ncbi:MAG: DNA polymerase III subunit gamma/tau [Cyclobacteriaceae bacterium]|nr:MAG: DNA polymerase III subunit gamma/tau [Cyclobacteriaceae bacterium]
MEQFVVSARKYRPSSFDSVIGQDHITKTLQNAIEKNQLAQALLFCGPRGVGKTTCARILAQAINEFDDSQQLSQSMNIYELDAASNNSVDDIRNLIDQVRYPPQYGKFKVYIIDEVHMLSNQAFNAFLKTLEEPPSYAIFILATTEKHKVIPTILSRCQIYDFNRIGIEDMVEHLKFVAKKEQVEAETEALHLIAQKADGALRDALSFFDMIVTFSADNKVTLEATLHNLHVLDYDYYFRITDYLLQENTSDTLLTLDEILSKGFDSHNFINGLSEHFRNLMVCKDQDTVRLMEVSESVKQRYLKQCQETSLSFLLTALNICNQCDLEYKSSKNPRLHVEIALMKIAHVPSAVQLATEQVKKKTFKGSAESIEQGAESIEHGAESIEKGAERAGHGAESREQGAESTGHGAEGMEQGAEGIEHGAESIEKGAERIEQEAESMEQGAGSTGHGAESMEHRAESGAQIAGSIVPGTKIESPGTKRSPQSTVHKVHRPKLKTTKLPSINDLKNQISEGPAVATAKEPTKQKRSRSFKKQDLLRYWNEFAEEKRKGGKQQEYLVLSQQPELIDNLTVQIKLNSSVQIDTVDRLKSDLMPFLRNKLDNDGLKLEAELELDDSKPLIYTPAEKFNYLAEKHPNLKRLQEKLGLDPDF